MVPNQRSASSGVMLAGRYLLGARLGSGAGGTVWLAQDQVLGRAVAVKEIARAQVPYDGATLLEARAAARVSHRGVVAVHDLVVDDARERDWIVMEALSGQSLADVLRGHGGIGLDEARFIGRHVLSALTSIHDAGLVHGDVKPANIHLCRDGRVVLTDFGLAAAPRRTGGIASGWIAGSLPFLAPEILTDGDYSPASDLYALGMTLYAALTGRAAGVALDASALGRPVKPDDRLLNDASTLGHVIRGLIHEDPRQRLDAVRAGRLLSPG